MHRISLHLSAVLLLIAPAALAITDAELSEAAAAVNQQAPLMVDTETRLEGATADKQTLTYNYTLINYSASDLDTNKFKEALRPNLIKAGCQALMPLLNEGINIYYVYQGKDKSEIAKLVLTAADCK